MNFKHLLPFLVLFTAPIYAMEKRPTDTQLTSEVSKKACHEIAQPIAGQSHFEQLPLDVKRIILKYLSHADGRNEDSQMRNAAKNMRHCMSLSKTMRRLESDLETHTLIIPALANGDHEKLFSAAIALHTNGAAAWIKKNADENITIHYNRELFDAIQTNDVASAAFIVKHNPQSVNQKITIDGFTPLILASAKGKKKIVSLLLAAQANITAFNLNNETALWLAVAHNDIEIAQMLLEHASQSPEFGNYHLQTLLNIADRSNWHKPLAQAVLHENIPMIQLLLNSGATPNNSFIGRGSPSFHNISVLLHAAAMGNHAIVDLLLNAGAYENTRSFCYVATLLGKKPDMTPLMLAAQNGYPEVVKRLLLQPNIDIKARSVEGKTALDFAQKSYSENKEEIIKLLKEHMAKINKKNLIYSYKWRKKP